MNLFTIGLVLDTTGKILIGIAVLIVHRHIFKEHKIGLDVLKSMRKEWVVTILGIVFIIIGSFMQLISHLE